jgi:hypothetical protein
MGLASRTCDVSPPRIRRTAGATALSGTVALAGKIVKMP